jgi:hypothetical protein
MQFDLVRFKIALGRLDRQLCHGAAQVGQELAGHLSRAKVARYLDHGP